MLNEAPERFSQNNIYKYFLYAAIAFAAITSGYGVYRFNQPKPPDEATGFLWPDPKILSGFELNSTQGPPLNLERLKGKWTFLFFGFTYCPDICPTTLSIMANVIKRLKADRLAENIQMVFVSVDPARDTIDRMSKYVSYFDDTFIGATAPLEALDELTSQIGILHIREAPDDNGNYHVDHSAAIALIDPELRYVGIFQTPHSAEKITAEFISIRKYLESL